MAQLTTPGGTSPLAALRHALLDAIRGRHVRAWIIAVVSVTVIGAAGYVVLFRWSLSDAIYMTAITLTTVGFREVHELSDFPQRLWTMMLAVAGGGRRSGWPNPWPRCATTSSSAATAASAPRSSGS